MPGFTGFVAILFSFNCQRRDYSTSYINMQGFFRNSSAIRNGRDDLCLYKEQPAPFLIGKVPDNEQRSRAFDS